MEVSMKMAQQGVPDRIFGEQDFPAIVVVSQSKNHMRFDTNFHPELEFHLIRHGTTEYQINDVTYCCERNSILIMHENEPHAWLCDKGCLDKNMSLVFNPRILEGREVSHATLHRIAAFHHLVLPDDLANNVEFLLNEIGEECIHKGPHWQDMVVEYLETFLTLIHRAGEGKASAAENKSLLVQEIIRYIESGYEEKISLVEVAKRFNLPSSVLSKKFKQHAGIGFREYLIHRRIVAAQKLLEETDLKVSAIASKVGFDSLTTFNRDFRLLTGVTPAVYRTVSETNQP